MAQLPQKLSLPLMQTKWASILNPILKNPLNGASILENVSLISGNNQIPHLLGRMQQGWFLVDINGASAIYRYLPLNDTFLYLNSSVAVVASIGVF